jgi:type II secretory ATPase GspE/PulE/Tfp pilus assembly ATPase PilB-like protein
LEDPVEYEIPGIEQSQINAGKWYTFEEWLKSILRHDPDVIMVWEIRTAETAEIAFNAALTGHLVLATVHTNSATEAITRLLNLGIKPYMLAPALNLIIWQRLVRKLHTCMTWREASMPESQEIKSVITTLHDVTPHTNIEFKDKVPHAVWCDECQTDGYKWRTASVELLDMTQELRQMLIDGKSTMELYGALRQSWFVTMKENAYIKMLEGATTLEEIRRVM